MVASNKHEVVDARVWNAFYGKWWPLNPFTRLEYEHTADWAINTATATVPDDHPAASIFAKVEEGIPAPVTITLNGVVWTGQITTAYSFNEKGKSGWKLTLSSDDKHFHRMMARPPAQSAADDTETRLAGFLGPITEQLVSVAATRTGVPTYVVIEAEGDPVELQARTENSVADVLADATQGSNLLVETRMVLPGQDFPGGDTETSVTLYQGDMERRWANEQLANDVWPHAATHPRLTDKRAMSYPIVPPYSWNGAGNIDIGGTKMANDVEGIAWRPFQIKPVQDGSYFGSQDSYRARVMTRTELATHHQKFGVLPWFVTEWKPNTFNKLHDQQHLEAAAQAGLLRRADGVQISPDRIPADVYVWIGQQAAYAWLDEAGWVIGLQQHIDAEIASRTPNGVQQRQIPGLMVHLYPERDRRGIVFSSVPGGGLSSWGITHSAPEGAMLISGVQMDALLLEYLQSGEASEQAVFGQRGLLSVDEVNAITGTVSGTVDSLAIDVDPQRTLAGTDVSFHKAGAKVNIAQAGLFFYREQYSNLSTGSANPVTEMVKQWKAAQGGTSATLTVGATENVVFGDDVHLPDGRVLDGWRPGDRVSFVDKTTRISELIVGYKVVAEADKPLSVTPLIGGRDNGVISQLGDRLRGAESAAKQAQLAAQRRIPAKEIEDRAEDVFAREGTLWSEIIRETVEEGRQHVIDAEGHAADARANAEAAFGEAERAVGLVADANVIIDQAQEKLDTIPKIIESGRWWAQMSAAQSASSQMFASQALVHADKADEHAQAALLLVDDALALVETADAALDLIEVELGKIPGLIAQGEQHVEDAAGHAQDARETAASAQGLVTTATNLVADANLILDAANVEMGKIPGIIAQGEQHVIDAGNYAQAAFGHADDARDLVADANLILGAANVELAKIPGLIAEGEQHVADALGHSQDAGVSAGLADAAVIAANELVDEADAILVDARALHATIQPMIDEGAQHVTDAKNHADRADQAVTDAGAAKTAAETALTNATNLLADIDGEGTDFPTAVTQVLGAHNEVLTKHGEVITKHGEAINAASDASRDAGLAADKALEIAGVLTETQALHTEVLTKHGQAIRAAGSASAMASMAAMQATETARSAALAAQSALDIAQDLAEVQAMHTEVLAKHGEAITAATNTATDATNAADSATKASDDALKAADKLTTVQTLHGEVLTKHGEAIVAVAGAASFAAAAAADAAETGESAALAASQALEASNALGLIQLEMIEVDRLQNRAIRAVAGATTQASMAATQASMAGRSAAQAAGEAGKAAESASKVADDALDAAGVLAAVQGDALEVQRLHGEAIVAVAGAASYAAAAAVDAAETGESAAQAAEDALNAVTALEGALTAKEAAEAARDQTIADVSELAWLSHFRRTRVAYFDRQVDGQVFGTDLFFDDGSPMFYVNANAERLWLSKRGTWSGTMKLQVMTITSTFGMVSRTYNTGSDGQEDYHARVGDTVWQRFIVELYPEFPDAATKTKFESQAVAYRPLM